LQLQVVKLDIAFCDIKFGNSLDDETWASWCQSGTSSPTFQRYMEFYNKAISNPSLVADLARMPITEAYRELGSLRGYRPRGYVLRRRANLISHFVISSLDDETWASY